MPHDVFICHAAKNKAVADAACHLLEQSGLRCWIAPRDVPHGSVWTAAIVDAITASRAMLVIVSEPANESPQVLREVERAVSAGLPILPMRIEPVELSKPLLYLLGSQHWMDALTPPLEDHLRTLAESLHALLVSTPKPLPPQRRLLRPRAIVIAGGLLLITTLGGLYLWKPWAMGSSTTQRPRAFSDPALGAFFAVIHRLDDLHLAVESGLSDATLESEFKAPAAAATDADRQAWYINVSEAKVKLCRTIEADAKDLLAPIDALSPRNHTTLLGAVDMSALELAYRDLVAQADFLRTEAEGFDKELKNLRTHSEVSPTPADIGFSIQLGKDRLSCWRETLLLAINAAYLRFNVESQGSLMKDEKSRAAAVKDLATLRRLRPAELVAADSLTQRLEDIQSRSAAQIARYKELTEQPDPVMDQMFKELASLRSQYDDFKVLNSDTSDRIIEKAVVARSARLTAESSLCLDEYERRFGESDAAVKPYVKAARLLAASEFSPKVSAQYVQWMDPSSPAQNRLRVGDIILEADGKPTMTNQQVVDILRASAGRSVTFTVLRESGQPVVLMKQKVVVDVSDSGSLRVVLVLI